MRAVFFSAPEGVNNNQLFATALRSIFLMADEVVVAGEYAGRMHADELLKKQTLMQKVATMELNARIVGNNDILEMVLNSKEALQQTIKGRYIDNTLFVAAKRFENQFNKIFSSLYGYFADQNKDSNLFNIIPLVKEGLLHTALLEYSSAGGGFITKNAETTANKLIDLVFPAKSNGRPSLLCFPQEFRNVINAHEKQESELSEDENNKMKEGKRINETVRFCLAIPSYSTLAAPEIKLLKQEIKPIIAPLYEKMEAWIDITINQSDDAERPRQIINDEIQPLSTVIQKEISQNKLLNFNRKEGLNQMEMTPILFLGALPIEDVWKMFWVRDHIDEATLDLLISKTKDRERFPRVCPTACFTLYLPGADLKLEKDKDNYETKVIAKKKSISLDDDDESENS